MAGACLATSLSLGPYGFLGGEWSQTVRNGWGPPMHKTSDSVEIQETWTSSKRKEIGKIIFSVSPNRTNTDEFGRNPKNKAPCFPQCEFLCGRIRTSFFLSDFPRISENCRKITDKFRRFFLLSFNSWDRDMTLYRFWWVGGRQRIGDAFRPMNAKSGQKKSLVFWEFVPLLRLVEAKPRKYLK